MSSTTRLAWGVCAACFVLTATGLGFLALNDGTATVNTLGSPEFDAIFSVVYLAFPVVGALIASRQPRNAIGWLFLAVGLGRGIDYAFLGYAVHALIVAPGSLPGGALAGLVADLTWVPTLLGGTALLFLLFPAGRLPSRRWRPLIWASPRSPSPTSPARRSSRVRSITSPRSTTRSASPVPAMRRARSSTAPGSSRSG